MKRILLVWIALVLPYALSAEKVTENKARAIATHFLQANQPSRASTIHLEMVYDGRDVAPASSRTSGSSSTTAAEPPFYVYNDLSNKRFVIVSGDDRAMPILGFSDQRTFTLTSAEDGIQSWMNGIKNQLAWMHQHQTAQSQEVATAWKEVSTRAIKPILKYETALWGLGAPLNKEVPGNSTSTKNASLDATLIAILMRHREWPHQRNKEIPSYSYNRYDDGKEFTVAARPVGGPYEWDQMPLTIDEYTTEEQLQQIIRLVGDCSGMIQYTEPLSNSVTGYGHIRYSADKALPVYMDYSTNVIAMKRYNYTRERWNSMIKESLKETGPLLYIASDLLLIDGYLDGDFYSINWGNYGINNGYFRLDVGMDGIKDFYIDQRNDECAYFNLEKKTVPQKIIEEVVFDGLKLKASQIQVNKEFRIGGTCSRIGINIPNDYELAIWLTDAKGKRKELLSEIIRLHQDNPGYGLDWPELTCKTQKGVLQGDRIRVFFRSAVTPEWTMITERDLSPWEFIIADSNGNIKKISDKISFSMDFTSGYITLKYSGNIQITVMRWQQNMNHLCTFKKNECMIPIAELYSTDMEIVFKQEDVIEVLNLGMQAQPY